MYNVLEPFYKRDDEGSESILFCFLQSQNIYEVSYIRKVG